MADLDTIDGQLDELRAVPDNLDELIARYGERDRTLERIDDVLAALAAGTRPRTVPPLGATPSEPPVYVPSSVRPTAVRMSSRPPRAKSQPAPAAPSAPAPRASLDFEALFGGPESVLPAVPSVQPLAASEPALALELESERPALELEAEASEAAPVEAASHAAAAEPARDEPAAEATVARSSGEFQAPLAQATRASERPSIRDTQPEPLPVSAVATDSAELDAVLGDAPAPGEPDADEEDGFEMMVEEDDILEIDSDDLEMVDEP